LFVFWISSWWLAAFARRGWRTLKLLKSCNGVVLSFTDGTFYGIEVDLGGPMTLPKSEVDFIEYRTYRGEAYHFYMSSKNGGRDISLGNEGIDIDPKVLAEKVAALTDLQPAPKKRGGFGADQYMSYQWFTPEVLEEVLADLREEQAARERRKARRKARELMVGGEVGAAPLRGTTR
jgi:hypothetical protein